MYKVIIVKQNYLRRPRRQSICCGEITDLDVAFYYYESFVNRKEFRFFFKHFELFNGLPHAYMVCGSRSVDVYIKSV